MTPAAPATDAEFLRRVYLDLVGSIPSVSVARDFLEDNSSEKRSELVGRLLASPRHTTHFARVLRARLAPEATKDFETLNLALPLDRWLRKRVAQNAGYDKLVRELLSTPVTDLQRGYNQNGDQDSEERGPAAWLLLKEAKPENLASGSARDTVGPADRMCRSVTTIPSNSGNATSSGAMPLFSAGSNGSRTIKTNLGRCRANHRPPRTGDSRNGAGSAGPLSGWQRTGLETARRGPRDVGSVDHGSR